MSEVKNGGKRRKPGSYWEFHFPKFVRLGTATLSFVPASPSFATRATTWGDRTMLGCFFVATARVAAYDAMQLLVCFLLHPFFCFSCVYWKSVHLFTVFALRSVLWIFLAFLVLCSCWPQFQRHLHTYIIIYQYISCFTHWKSRGKTEEAIESFARSYNLEALALCLCM